MKFLHLGDLHIGKNLNDFDLIEDQAFILEKIYHIAKEEKADGILIAGDVYDRAVPSEAAVRLFDSFLCKLAKAKIKTFLISGNHDSDERLNFGSSLFETNGIYISAVYDGVLYRQEMTDEFGKINVYLLPFVKASQVRHFFPEEKILTYDDAVRVIVQHANIDETQRNVCVAHQFVTGDGEDPNLSGSEGGSVTAVGTVEKIGYHCFDSFDYVALGHIHSGQRVGRDQVRYSGSLLKYSLSEVNHQKSVPVVNISQKGKVDIKLVPLVPKRDVRHLKGTLEKLLAKENVQDTQDFIYATLTDEDTVNDAMGIFRQVYPNTVKIDYDNSHTRQIEQISIENIAGQKSFDELIGDFYKQVYGVDIEKEEALVMKEVAKEAGLIDETD